MDTSRSITPRADANLPVDIQRGAAARGESSFALNAARLIAGRYLPRGCKAIYGRGSVPCNRVPTNSFALEFHRVRATRFIGLPVAEEPRKQGASYDGDPPDRRLVLDRRRVSDTKEGETAT